jgi:hypothetical protein
MPGVVSVRAVCVPVMAPRVTDIGVGMPEVSDVGIVAPVPSAVAVAVVHEPAYGHDAQAYATDGETDEVQVHS